MTPQLQFKKRVIRKVEEQGISPRFAMLLIGYEDRHNRMEAFYWDSDKHKAVRVEKLQDAFGLKRYEARSLSRVFEAAKPAKTSFATQDVRCKGMRK